MERLLLYQVVRLLMKVTLLQYTKRHFVFSGTRFLFSTRHSSWKERRFAQHRIGHERSKSLSFERQPRSLDGFPRAGIAGAHTKDRMRRAVVF